MSLWGLETGFAVKRNKKDAYLMMIQGYALSFDHKKLFCGFSTELPCCQNSNKHP